MPMEMTLPLLTCICRILIPVCTVIQAEGELLFVASTPNEVSPSRVLAVKDSQMHFVAGCHKRRGCFCPLSYSSLLPMVFLVFCQGHFDYVWLFCLSWLLWFDCEHYSRRTDWKDTFPKWPVMCWLGRQTLLTHDCLVHWVEWTMLILSCDNLVHAPSNFTDSSTLPVDAAAHFCVKLRELFRVHLFIFLVGGLWI